MLGFFVTTRVTIMRSDLHTIIILSGNKRLPDIEHEIFADKSATYLYLSQLTNHSYPFGLEGDAMASWAVFQYAYTIMCARWPEAEHLILLRPHAAYCYAKFVIKGRWVEGESIIKTSPDRWSAYERHCLYR